MQKKILSLVILALCLSGGAFAQKQHPNLILTQEGVKAIRDGLGKYPLLDQSFSAAKDEVEANIQEGVVVPLPVDAGGGYTHEKHKANYNAMYKAGVLWQVLGDQRYANYVRSMLLAYAEMYPTLGIHPEGKNSGSPGKLFWQSLNDAVWLVHVIQAYDCVYDILSADDRLLIEKNLLRLAVKFNSEDCYKTFNMIHNHGAWNVAGVIMTGYVIGDNDMVEKGLKGSKKDGNKAGFLEQIRLLYSPDGYYIEGAYYLRYAYMPFGLTAKAISNNQPELNIFAFKDSTLAKAPLTLLQLTDSKGQFLPFNDAILDKAWTSHEVVYAVDIAYSFVPDPSLLWVAQIQGSVMLSAEGVAVAKALAEGKRPDNFVWKSTSIRDGWDGKQGGLGIFRHGEGKEMMSLIFKYGIYGMEHGHFDKLSLMLYDQDQPILSDYGAVRFHNMVQKRGGRYLPENKSWGKHTIAHNTVTVDGRSNYNAKSDRANECHSVALYYDASRPDFQVMSAYDTSAYEGVNMQRSLAMIQAEGWEKPCIVDLYRLASDKAHTYEMAYYYKGDLIETNIPYTHHKQWEALGKANGYQHLFLVGDHKADSAQTLFTWHNSERFYSINSITHADQDVFFVQLGANDPEMSLRPEKGFILKANNASTHTFASVIEPHGEYNSVQEYSLRSFSKFAELKLLKSDAEAHILYLKEKNGKEWILMLANSETDPLFQHRYTVGQQRFSWTGTHHFEAYSPSKYEIPTQKKRR